MVQSNETPFETNYRLQITFNFHVHHQIVLQVAENVAQNESFVMSTASKVTPFDGRLWNELVKDYIFFCEIDYVDFKEFIEQWGGPNLDDGFCYV